MLAFIIGFIFSFAFCWLTGKIIFDTTDTPESFKKKYTWIAILPAIIGGGVGWLVMTFFIGIPYPYGFVLAVIAGYTSGRGMFLNKYPKAGTVPLVDPAAQQQFPNAPTNYQAPASYQAPTQQTSVPQQNPYQQGTQN